MDAEEVRYPTDEECEADPSLGCRDIQKNVSDNLQNRFQNWDLLYGRVWGTRKFEGRWFAGLRYMTYEGNLPDAAGGACIGRFYHNTVGDSGWVADNDSWVLLWP